MCDMTESYVWHDSFTYLAVFICVTWLNHMYDMTHSRTWPHSYVWHDWIIPPVYIDFIHLRHTTTHYDTLRHTTTYYDTLHLHTVYHVASRHAVSFILPIIRHAVSSILPIITESYPWIPSECHFVYCEYSFVSRLWMYLFWNMNTSRRNTKTMSLYLFLKMNKPRDTSESCYLASQNYSSLLQKSPIKETKEPSKRDTSESCYMSYQLFCVCVRRHAIYGAKWHELCYGAKWHEPSDMSQVTWVTWLILSLL